MDLFSPFQLPPSSYEPLKVVHLRGIRTGHGSTTARYTAIGPRDHQVPIGPIASPAAHSCRSASSHGWSWYRRHNKKRKASYPEPYRPPKFTSIVTKAQMSSWPLRMSILPLSFPKPVSSAGPESGWQLWGEKKKKHSVAALTVTG